MSIPHHQAIAEIKSKAIKTSTRWRLITSPLFRSDLDHSINEPSWVIQQFDGVPVFHPQPDAVFPEHNGFIIDHIEWCVRNCKGEFYRTNYRYPEIGIVNLMMFANPDDAIKFKLVWG